MSSEKVEANLANALHWQGADPMNWVPPHAGIDHDVFIVGGGQTGVAIAYGLRRKGITKTAVIDAGEEDASMWRAVARMNLLRTPKHVGGPEFGNVLLGFRAWYDTQHGAGAFDKLERIPRLDWAAYVEWFRRGVKIPVRYGTTLSDIEPLDGGFRLHLNVEGKPTVETARKVVLATGFPGGGYPFVPDFVRKLPRHLWSHTVDAIDFQALRGKVVGVLGLGPSALDAAGTALEGGAKAVHLLGRRGQITYPHAFVPGKPPIGKFYPGAADNFYLLPDELRWRHQLIMDEVGATTPLDSIQRATQFDNFHIHLGLKSLNDTSVNGAVNVPLNGETLRLDHLISATGYAVDVTARPELQRFANAIMLWNDRYDPSWGPASARAGAYPYLGPNFEFLEKRPGAAPFLKDIHCYNIGAAMSSGKYLCDVPSMTELPRLISGIGQGLFFDDYESHARRINMFDDAPHDPAPYARSVRTKAG